MQTFKTISTATAEILGRRRNRYEVEHGCTMAEAEGLRYIESIRMIRTEAANFEHQSITDDYQTITLRGERNVDGYSTAALLDKPIHYFIGGEFYTEEMQKRRYRQRPGVFGYKDMLVKVKHSVLYSQYRVSEVIENGDGTCDVTLDRV